MIRCPICKSIMLYKNGESKGRKYEFYGCSRYPNCRGIVEMDELEKYDDGIQSNRIEKTVEEEGDDVMNIFLSEGYDFEASAYAKHMLEKF